MSNKYISPKLYLYDEIKGYEKKIKEREQEKINILNLKNLQDYQITVLTRQEDKFIEHYKARIKARHDVLNDKDFMYILDLNIRNNVLSPSHIHLVLNAYWKKKEFEDAKIDIRSYSEIKRKNPDTPDSISMIRKELTESLRFANYSDSAVKEIMKFVIGRASKGARKQNEKTKDGRTIHFFQFIQKIE